MKWTGKRTLTAGGLLVGVTMLYVMGAEERQQQPTQTSVANTAQCRVTVTADVLNVRAEPNTSSAIVDKLTVGTETDAAQVEQNGFRKLADGRWVSAEYVDPVDGTSC